MRASPDILIAGGGLAGGAAGAFLARAGREVVLCERREHAADKICGEFLSAEAGEYLQRLGIDVAAFGAHRIGALRLVCGERSVSVPLPFSAFGLSRRVLDEALLRCAENHGATILCGHAVRLRGLRPLTVEHETLGMLCPERLFLATGKHDVRGLQRPPRPARNLVGFKLHWRLEAAQHAALSGHIELILLQDGYAGLQCIENGLANLCLLVSARRLAQAGGSWDGLLGDLLRTEPHLRARLAGGVPQSAPISIARVPYGHVHRHGADDPAGLFRLGDQFAVIPSFTGDGMSIALHSAFAAAEAVCAGADAGAYHARLRRALRWQIGRAMVLDRASRMRALAFWLAAFWPSALRHAASLTRVARA